MAVEALYLINEKVEETVAPFLDGGSLVLRPGKFVADCADDIDGAGMYVYTPNVMNEMPYVNTDVVRIILYHRRFETCARMADAVLGLNKLHALGIYNKLLGSDDYNSPIEPGNPGLYNDGIAEGIKFHDVVVTSGGVEKKDFIDGTDYYCGKLDIVFQYVEGV